MKAQVGWWRGKRHRAFTRAAGTRTHVSPDPYHRPRAQDLKGVRQELRRLLVRLESRRTAVVETSHGDRQAAPEVSKGRPEGRPNRSPCVTLPRQPRFRRESNHLYEVGRPTQRDCTIPVKLSRPQVESRLDRNGGPGMLGDGAQEKV